MLNIYETLSGAIPGGAVLLLAALIFINLALVFFKNSGLFKKNQMTRKVISYNFIIILVYSVLWIYTRPDPLPVRIIVLPTFDEDRVELKSESLLLAELFQKNNYSIQGRYIVHDWRWMYKTLDNDSLSSANAWLTLGQRLKPHILIKSQYAANGDLLIKAIIYDDEENEISFSFPKQEIAISFQKLLNKIDLDLINDSEIKIPEAKYLAARLKIVQSQADLALTLMENDSSLTANIVRAEAYVYKGLEFKYNYVKMKYVKIVNPDFEQAKAILYPIIKSRKDLPVITYLLGRIALREQDYESAEVFLKITYTQELWNSRIYYHLNHLLSSRLVELGFKDRFQLLEKAVDLDPGYTQAVLDLANEAYLRGTGAEQGAGTQYALGTLERFLYLNENDPQVLSLLATLYIKTEKLDQAESIYNKMLERYPDDSNLIYDLGIIQYLRHDYKSALDLFKQSIAMDNNLDAYLYAGITLEMMGEKRQALKYYQDRVRYKESDDDIYAQEAMHGIRNILEELENQKPDSLKK